MRRFLETLPDRRGAGRGLLLALPMGALLAWAPGAFFVLTLVLLTCGFLRRFAAEEDRRLLTVVFLASFGVRFVLAALYQFFGVEAVAVPVFAPDGERYSTAGWYISNILSGETFERLHAEEFRQLFPSSIKHLDYADIVHRFGGQYLPRLSYLGPFTYGVAFFYSMVGYAPLAFKWVNGFMGSLLPLLAYGMGKAIFSRRAGRMAAVLVALHPFLLAWSITALKDTPFIFSGSLFLYSLVGCLSGRWVWLLGLAAGAGGMVLLREWATVIFWLALGLGTFGGLVIYLLRMRRWVRGGVAAALVVGFILGYPAMKTRYEEAVSWWKLRYASLYGDPALTKYRILPKEVYDNGFRRPLSAGDQVHALAGSLSHFLYSPYPCCADGLDQAVSAALSLLWYALIPFVLLGYLRTWREKPLMAWYLGLFAAGAAILLGLLSTNVGTLIRHRDLLTPLVLVWAAGGLSPAWSRIRPALERRASEASPFGMAKKA
ncbi:MAG: glycosyltransferase family 39 protein [Nitrospinota bacterium]